MRQQPLQLLTLILGSLAGTCFAMASNKMIIKADERDSSGTRTNFRVDVTFVSLEQDDGHSGWLTLTEVEFLPPVEIGDPPIIFDAIMTKEGSFSGTKRDGVGDATFILSLRSDGTISIIGSMSSEKFVYRLSTLSDGIYIDAKDVNSFPED